jgi:phosphoribosylformylglycinamidine synthase
MACSLIEMAAKGKVGMEVELSKVPVQNKKLKPLEILLSETQQRIVMVVEKDNEKEVDKIFKKWDIKASQIGTITKEDQIIFKFKDEIVAELPPQALVSGIGAPVYDRQYSEPDYVLTSKNFSINDLPEPENLKEVAWSLIKNPNISSKQWIIQQFDSTIGSNNLSSNFPSDAAIINIKDTNLALVLNLDCNGRYVKADPAQGAAIAVADASRNIICAGGIPIAVTNCLNFGNPYNPEVFWQFVESINGLGEACRKFNIPVTGGKVSFYNQLTIKDKEFPILPTPVIGMIGLITDKNDQMTKSFKSKGDMIFLIGETRNDIYSSEYLVSYHKVKNSPPPFFDLDFEFKLQETVRGLIQHRFIRSAHDISEGGLFITLLESGMPNELGFDVTTDSEIRTDAFMFGESQGRIVVSVTPHKEAEFIDYMIESGIPTLMLGHVTKGEMRVDEVSFGFVKDAKKAYDGALENIISK